MSKRLSLVAGLIAGVAFAVLSGSAAHAKDVLCGYYAVGVPVPPSATVPQGVTNNVGVLLKIRTEDAGYKTDCDKASNKIKAQLPALPPGHGWQHANRKKCSDFNNIFVATGGAPPVCSSVPNKHVVQATTTVIPGKGEKTQYKDEGKM
jgi:hypothetical protein